MKFYDEMFKALTNLKPATKPMTVTMDFESVASVSIRTAIPQVNVEGCFFHRCPSVHIVVARFGLKTNYADDPLFAQQI